MDYYKEEEIKQYFYDYIEDQDKDWILENKEDLHHHCFNTDYYIIGTYQAEQWLGNHVFEVINIIKDYEQDNFGQVSTDLSSAESVVNMYAYIVGEKIVYDYLNQLDSEVA